MWLCGTVIRFVDKTAREGITILLVEQNVEHVLQVAGRGYVLENGRIVLEERHRLLKDPGLKTAYLGL
jgi:branched-chain amino acid transport system ATP-binding protein